jgi:hypothetical protein
MGRTLPTQIQLLREAEETWKDFRRALRKEDQDIFDTLWSYARQQSASASMAARALPFEAHCLAMLVGLQREIDELKRFRGMNDLMEDGYLREKETIAPSEKPVLFSECGEEGVG